MNKLTTILLLIILISAVPITAQCNEEQIDINSASLEELDNLSGIGPVKAQAIIDARPFNNIDELIDVNGIKNATLNGIKQQGLACISSKEENKDANESEEKVNDTHNIIQQTINDELTDTIEVKKPIISEMILLTPKNPKDIKTNNNVLTSDNIAIYGLFGFCILLGILFMAGKIKKSKTEFKD